MNETTTTTLDNTTALLTRHPAGSIKELWTISFPLILSALSGTIMLFLDRVILAQYSTEAMNAAASASMVFFAYMFFIVSIAGISEVFVGQHNGAKKYTLISQPVWQMIWFSIFMIVPSIIIGVGLSPLLVPLRGAEHGVPYLSTLLCFGTTFGMTAALAGFFIGRGEVRVVTLTTIMGTLINLVLDILLVFGVEGLIPPMGTFGAALATGLAQLSMVIVLFGIFIQKRYQTKYQTLNYQFNKSVFQKCLKIGAPNAIGHLVGILAWGGVMHLLAEQSFEHITVFTIGQSIWMLFSFMTDGSQKAVSAVTSNMIGANLKDKVHGVLKSGIILQLYFALFLVVPLIIFPGLLVNRFLPDTMDIATIESLRQMTKLGLTWMWFAFIFDAITWVIAGILTAAGDTRFIMMMSAINSWVFAIVPMYVFIILMNGQPATTLGVICWFTILNAACFYFRYLSGKWKKLEII